MQLVQLSDIHVGSFFKQRVFDTVVEEVNKLNPDAIIITGDLTDEGLLFQFEQIHTQIKKFTCSNISLQGIMPTMECFNCSYLKNTRFDVLNA